MRASKLVTKAVVRVFFILVFAASVPFLVGDQNKFKNIYFTFRHKWEMIFPGILLTGFVVLLIMSALKKFEETELNFLLVLNTCILFVYGIAIFIRIVHMV